MYIVRESVGFHIKLNDKDPLQESKSDRHRTYVNKLSIQGQWTKVKILI